MRRKDELEERRKAAGLPPGATRDEIISAESQLEFLEKATSGDAEQMRKIGFGQTAPGTALKGKFIYDLIRLSDSMIESAMEPLYPAFNPKHKKGQRPKRPTGKAAGGGPFLDYKSLPGPGLITQQMWDEFGKFESEGGDDPVAQRDKRFVDAFGKPGGPGYYVEKAAWMTAYAISELKRQKRDRFRTQKGTGKRIKVGGKQDLASKEVQRIRGPKNLRPGSPAHTRSLKKRQQGMARANARNSKRLAGINKIRVKNNLAPLGPDDVNEFGVPLMGWKDARSRLLKKDVTLLDPNAVTVAAPSAPHVAAPDLAQQRLPTAEEKLLHEGHRRPRGLEGIPSRTEMTREEMDQLAADLVREEQLKQGHLRPRGLEGIPSVAVPPPAPPLPGTIATPEYGPGWAPITTPPPPPLPTQLPTQVVTPRLLDPTLKPEDAVAHHSWPFRESQPNVPFFQGATPPRKSLQEQLDNPPWVRPVEPANTMRLRRKADELEELRRRKEGPMSAGDVQSGAFRMNRGGFIPGYNMGWKRRFSVLGALTPWRIRDASRGCS